jgi:hypothetical protein
VWGTGRGFERGGGGRKETRRRVCFRESAQRQRVADRAHQAATGSLPCQSRPATPFEMEMILICRKGWDWKGEILGGKKMALCLYWNIRHVGADC